MGALPSSEKNKKVGKLFMNKKIFTNIPIYLIRTKIFHDSDNFYYVISTNLMSRKNKYDLAIKLKPGISFVIDDIISYCYNEGGVYAYECWLVFLNNINNNDILKIIGDKSLLEEIYDHDKDSFNMKKLNKKTFCDLIMFANNFAYDMTHEYNAIEKNTNFISKQLNDCHTSYNRTNKYRIIKFSKNSENDNLFWVCIVCLIFIFMCLLHFIRTKKIFELVDY